MRIKHLFAIVLFALLAACGTTPTPKVSNDDATKIVATFMAQITQTAAAITPAAPTAIATEPPAATETALVPSTPNAALQLLERFRTVTVIKGNLFVRDGTGLPIQITKSGDDYNPIISADGRKIAFYRGAKFDKVLIINADGSQEKELVNTKLFPELMNGHTGALTFRPGTYDLLLNSYFCKETICEANLSFVDAESASVTKLVREPMPSMDGDLNFALSPDGKYISVSTPKHIDLYNLLDNSKVVSNIFSGASWENNVRFQYWLPDSSGLIVMGEMQGDYIFWRYSLKEDRAEQLQFVFPAKVQNLGEKMRCAFSISPDRNWIFYYKNEKEYAVGNLNNAQAKSYDRDSRCAALGVSWSPDSQHFASQTAIGSVDGTPPITLDGRFTAWVDATHYLFTKGKSILDLQTYIAEVGKESAAVPTNFIWSPVYAVLP